MIAVATAGPTASGSSTRPAARSWYSPARRRRDAGTSVDHFIERIGCRSHGAAKYATFIDRLRGERLVLENSNPLACVQHLGMACRQQGMFDFNLSLIHYHQRSGVFIFDAHIENRATHRDDGSWSANFVVIGLAADLLDLNFHAPEKNLEQVFPITGIIAENNAGVLEYFKGTAIGDLQ